MSETELGNSNLRDEMMAWRYDFHRHPELRFDEHRTAARVAKLPEGFGLKVHTGVGKTGVVGVLQRGNDTRSIGLRVDMDALPITEANDFPHKSGNDGVMHASGHDGHTAMLLGAAKRLAESGSFSGRAVFIFQPAEEHGKGGLAMIADGLLEKFPVDEVYGTHIIPGLEVETFAMRTGATMASEALFKIKIRGQGGHAAMPHTGVDAIVVGAEVVSALPTIVSRKLNPGLNGVVSVTEFRTDGQGNVLAGRAMLTVDTRALNLEINAEIERKIRQIVEGICRAYGVTGTVTYDTVFEVRVNAPETTRRAAECAVSIAGVNNVNSGYAPILAPEDFTHMAITRPGCFLFAGNGTNGTNSRPLHSADYDFKDELLVLGPSFWVRLVEQEFSED